MKLLAAIALFVHCCVATPRSVPVPVVPVPTAQAPTPVPLPSIVRVPSRTTVGRTSSGTGYATWYDDGPGLYGAVHSWHYGQHRYRVTVCAIRCVVVTIRDYCAGCGTGIDLSPSAFRALGYPLSKGRVKVTIR